MKLGFVTKFPVDFFFALENAAKAWDEAHPEAEVLFAQGQTATDDAGQIAPIESIVAQGVKGIAITPTSDAVIPALDEAIAAGRQGRADGQRPARLGRQVVGRRDRQPSGGVLAGEWLAGQLQAGDTLAMLRGRPRRPALDARVNGMKQGLGDLDVEVVGKAPTDCAQDKGVAAAEDILTAQPGRDGDLRRLRPAGVGAVQAIANAGIEPEDIILVGFDALPDEVGAHRRRQRGRVGGAVPGQDRRARHRHAAAGRQGETVETFVDTGTAIVTPENAADFE